MRGGQLMRKSIYVIIVCIMITIFSGCDVLKRMDSDDFNNDELHPVSSIVMSESEAKKLSDKMAVYLYFTNEDNSKLLTEIRYIPMSEAKRSVNNLASAIVKELINGPMKDTGLKPTIPEGTKLRSPISINAGIATVDLTNEFIRNHPGGKKAEQMTIYSIVNSLTEIKEIQKVRFAIDGKEVKEYKGSFKFDAPFPRSDSLISKESPAKSTMTDEVLEGEHEDSMYGVIEQNFQDSEEVLENYNESFEIFEQQSEETYIEILE